jgi:hypothetical protein
VIFLIDYDTRRGEIINLWEFQDAHKLRALYAKLQLELALAKRCDVLRETPILEAADLSTLKLNHRHYFAKPVDSAASFPAFMPSRSS